MLIECVLAIMTLIAVAYAYKWNAENPGLALKGATAIFGGGIAGMIDPSRGSVYHAQRSVPEYTELFKYSIQRRRI